MRVVVTGAAGFIGSHLAEALIAQGHDVGMIDNLSTGNIENVPAGGRFAHADITSDEVTGLIDEAKPEIVYHLAAQTSVRASSADPARDARANVEGTVRVLGAARQAEAKRVVLASSCAVYRTDGLFPTPEMAPMLPSSPYGQSKLAAEQYAALYTRLHGLSTVCLRLANVYGPRQDPSGEGGVIAIFQRNLAAGWPLVVYGTGEQTRDFVHISDAVDAFLRAGESDAQGALNVGTGVETSVLDLVALLAGEAARPVFAAARPGDVQRSCLDASLVNRVLGWRPQVALADGLAALAA